MVLGNEKSEIGTISVSSFVFPLLISQICMENREGSSVVDTQGTASASQTQNPCDDSLVFPKDFVIEKEDTPILDGVREGSGEVLYRATKHPDWSAFILRGEWVDDELHGKATLYHNTHPCLLYTSDAADD